MYAPSTIQESPSGQIEYEAHHLQILVNTDYFDIKLLETYLNKSSLLFTFKFLRIVLLFQSSMVLNSRCWTLNSDVCVSSAVNR